MKSTDRHGPAGVNADALKRLRRAEGQVRGIIRMVEEEKYCIDILDQIEAARSALRKAGQLILRRHIDHCVTGAVRSGGAESDALIDELMLALDRQGR